MRTQLTVDRTRSRSATKIAMSCSSIMTSVLLLLLFLFLLLFFALLLVAFGRARAIGTRKISRQVRIGIGRDHVMPSQPNTAHCIKSGTSLTGTSLAKAFTLRFRSSVSRTTSRLKRRGCPSSAGAKDGIPRNFFIEFARFSRSPPASNAHLFSFPGILW